MKLGIILAGALILGMPLTAAAANADHPYQNINRSNDAGNNTGDYQVDRLNQAQLNSNGVPAWSYPHADYGYAPPAYYRPMPGYVRVPRPYYYGYGY